MAYYLPVCQYGVTYWMGNMKTADLVNYYGSKAEIGRVLGITRNAVSIWREYPPPAVQLLFERITRGRLKAEANVWLRMFPLVDHPLVQPPKHALPGPRPKAEPRRPAGVTP